MSREHYQGLLMKAGMFESDGPTPRTGCCFAQVGVDVLYRLVTGNPIRANWAGSRSPLLHLHSTVSRNSRRASPTRKSEPVMKITPPFGSSRFAMPSALAKSGATSIC